ncbi:DUF3632 domain-containing protein [Aspergillus clavatus NRRL 1]|uniref:Uncharacterized protein n=1 Tax=Aspergillus clavatus (strain ATCC 1007 / CBS 513.65 / DSM 816 / NCTC 3887 / NRRL 1 / QM 1276 / 107) TaxID=344612 RepID=A1CSS3_ASPCL|nr:uncharacterized protein ACLA_080440 [Aspergillus clavatus NRRL 1]EAW06360.1 conserved hypothetical protein [Aspergillus clavatus NRRL 1]
MEGSKELCPSRPPSREMHASGLEDSPSFRQSLQDAIGRGEAAEIRDTMWNKVWYITMRYRHDGYSTATFEPQLHDFWYACYQAGRHISHESAEHDRLLLDILRFRAIGPLKRPAKHNHQDTEFAKTSAGVLWKDLPFLVTDMTDYWVNDCATMNATQRCNVARFLAKLASAGVSSDGLFQIALLTMRDALETARPLGSLKSPNEDNANRTMKDLTVADLLPAVHAWFQEARYKITQLSDELWNDCSDDFGRGGPTFLKSELGKRSNSGFSHWRWMFWLKRLEDIKQEAKEAGEKDIAELVSEIHESMTGQLEDGNRQVFEKFETAGELIPNRKDFSIRHLIDRVFDEWKQSNPEDDDGAQEAQQSLETLQIRSTGKTP